MTEFENTKQAEGAAPEKPAALNGEPLSAHCKTRVNYFSSRNSTTARR